MEVQQEADGANLSGLHRRAARLRVHCAADCRAAVPGWLSNWQTYAFVIRPLTFRQMSSIDGVFPNNPEADSVNVPLWTIRFELFCYILVALAGVTGILQRRSLVLLAFVGALTYYRLDPGTITVPFIDALEELPRFVTYFLAGSVVYLWRDFIPRSGALFAICVLVLLATRVKHSLIWPVLFPYCVLYVGMTCLPVRCGCLKGTTSPMASISTGGPHTSSSFIISRASPCSLARSSPSC